MNESNSFSPQGWKNDSSSPVKRQIRHFTAGGTTLHLSRVKSYTLVKCFGVYNCTSYWTNVLTCQLGTSYQKNLNQIEGMLSMQPKLQSKIQISRRITVGTANNSKIQQLTTCGRQNVMILVGINDSTNIVCLNSYVAGAVENVTHSSCDFDFQAKI